MKIAPSILSCDFSRLGEEITKVSDGGADLVHLDVMDGMFVPNISFGPDVIAAARPYTKLPFDVHLMIDKPSRYIDRFVASGADIITFHIEAEPDVSKTIRAITDHGVKAGLVVKPNTPIEAVFPYLESLYMVLIMTVEPGFGGQSFMYDMMKKVIALKKETIRRNLSLLIEVDGGINLETISVAAKAGADIAVAGTSVFRSENTKNAIETLKCAAENCLTA